MKIIQTKHGNYTLNEYAIEITENIKNQALSFATKIILSDNQYSRLLPSTLKNTNTTETIINKIRIEIQRTYVGKLGEMAFAIFLREKGFPDNTTDMFTIFNGQKNVDEYDFCTTDGHSIDIKTGFMSSHKLLVVNEQQIIDSPKDFYVGVKLNGIEVTKTDKLIDWDSITLATIKGYAEKDYLLQLNNDSLGEGNCRKVSYERLLGIDKLIKEHF